MHDYYVKSLGSYFRLSWVWYNACIQCVISITARKGDQQWHVNGIFFSRKMELGI